jgi:uncharacterized protein YbjT (DUF2867 family)
VKRREFITLARRRRGARRMTAIACATTVSAAGQSVWRIDKAFPYNFSEPHELEKSLRGIDVLINTYWVRFDNPPHFTFAQALANSKALFDAAKRAGIDRIVHISITNPDRKSPLPYSRGKAELGDYLKQTDISYVILRPAVLFGKEDILINNIAWALRRLPVFGQRAISAAANPR